MRHVLAALNMMLMAAANPAAAQTPVADLSLVLAVDGSSSVDIGEYALQMRGIAAAFRDPEVHGAIAAARPVRSLSTSWSGRSQATTR